MRFLFIYIMKLLQFTSFYILSLILLLLTSSCKSILYSIMLKKDIAKNVIVYENEKGKRLVYLGMAHLGKDGYYESVKTYVDSLRAQDYLVFYESVDQSKNDTILRKFKKVTGHYLTNFHDIENKSIRLPKSALKYVRQSLSNTGVNEKVDINADYSLDSLVYLYEKEYKPIVLTDCDWKTPLTEKYKCKDTVSHSRYNMLHTLRNKKVKQLVKENKNQDIIILYGAGHKFMLDSKFEKLGYKMIEGKLRVF